MNITLDQETMERIVAAVATPLTLTPKYMAACANLAIELDISVQKVIEHAIAFYQLVKHAQTQGYEFKMVNENGEDFHEPVGCPSPE